MFRRLIRPQIIKKICHTHSKTIFNEHKKSTDELLIQELSDINQMLLRIESETKVTHFLLFWIGVVISFNK